MNTPTKPTRTLELSVDVDATLEQVWKALTEAQGVQNWFPAEATLDKPGVGGTLTFSFGPEMAWPTTIDAWEPNKHVRWLNDDMMGPGTRLLADWYITTEKGKTRVRLVQSAFGESAGWDSFFEGTENGWKFFLYNLRIYLEMHAGKVRKFISSRFEVTGSRDAVWKKLMSTAAGLIVASGTALKAGEWVELKLTDRAALRAVVELIVEGHILAMRIPDLGDAVFFIELETGEGKFGVGSYLSIYDPKKAAEAEAPARRAMERVKAAMQ